MTKDTYTIPAVMNAQDLVFLMSEIMQERREAELAAQAEADAPLATVIQFPTNKGE